MVDKSLLFSYNKFTEQAHRRGISGEAVVVVIVRLFSLTVALFIGKQSVLTIDFVVAIPT